MKRLTGAFFVALIMAGCSPYSLVDSEVYNNTDLADYHTFRIVTPDEGHLPPGMEMVTYYNIAAAIREQLVERGFKEDPASDMLVNIGVTVKKEIATEPLQDVAPVYNPGPPAPMTPPPPAGPAHAPGPPPPAGPYYNGMYPYFMMPRSYYWSQTLSNASVITGVYKEGVLTMDLVNINKKLPLYSSSVATIIENGDGAFRNLSGIAAAVKVLFSRFPVPMLPQYAKDN